MKSFRFFSKKSNKRSSSLVSVILETWGYEKLKLSEDSNSQVQNTEDFVGIFSVQEGISHMY